MALKQACLHRVPAIYQSAEAPNSRCLSEASYFSEFIHFTHRIPMGSLLDGVVVQTIIETGLMGLRFRASGTASQLIERVKLCFMKLPSPIDFEAGGLIDLIHILEQHVYRAYCFSRSQFSASSNSDTSVKR